jgi:hypothetical protein
MYEVELDRLATGDLHRFSDWPNVEVPLAAAGVYSIWNQEGTYVYVGMSGRGLTAESLAERQAARKATGLGTRLSSHASGRRSGDQFCVYVCDRLVLPTLEPEQIQSVSKGEVSLDRVTRDYIHRELSYRYVVVIDGAAAFAIEDLAARSGLNGMLPLLNPRG